MVLLKPWLALGCTTFLSFCIQIVYSVKLVAAFSTTFASLCDMCGVHIVFKVLALYVDCGVVVLANTNGATVDVELKGVAMQAVYVSQ